jgi:hypothetical protein
MGNMQTYASFVIGLFLAGLTFLDPQELFFKGEVPPSVPC